MSRIPLLLAKMIAMGQVSLDQLDMPSWGWAENRKAAHRLAVSHGIKPAEYRNLAREWIEANPLEWQQLQALHAPQQEQSDAEW